jgi:hypothetical protein
MSRFTYSRGQWTDGHDLPVWGDDEEFTAYLERIGYSSSKLCVGSEHGSCLDIYESSDGGSFFVSAAPMGTTCYEVFLPDFPSLMLFLKEFGPAFSMLSTGDDHREVLALLEKLFRVYHGHAAYEICKQCDPQGWEASMRHREERAKAKGAGVTGVA